MKAITFGPKRILLVAGTGTLGGPTYAELARLGHSVDVISLEDFKSVTPQLSFLKADASTDRMERFLDGRHYDAIVDFLHVPEKEAQARRIDLMLDHTDQFVFLSSYRTYSGRDRVITEESEQWIDAPANDRMLAEDDYAIPKACGERHLKASGRKNWTVIRPIISFSHYRLDLVTVGAYALLFRTAAGKPIPLPEEVRDKHCGLTWGGNTGLQIAHLIGKSDALGEAFTLGTDEGLTWADVAAFYEELAGARFEWIPAEDYLRIATSHSYMEQQMIWTDRNLDRRVDFSKVMRVTGLDPARFMPCRDAIAHELTTLSERPDLVARFDTPFRREIDARMDAYFSRRGAC